MAIRNLSELVKASGGAGVAGESFGANVTGAAPGAGMRDYLLEAYGSWQGGPNPPDGFSIYPDGQTFTIVGSHTGGSRRHNVMRFGNVMGVVPSIAPDGFQVTLLSSNVETNGNMTASVEVRAPIGGGADIQPHAWYDGYTEPNEPTQAEGAKLVNFFPKLFGTTPPQGNEVNVEFMLQYNPNPNGSMWNPLVNHAFNFDMDPRTPDLTDYEYRWKDSGGTVVSTSVGHSVWSEHGEDWTFTLEGRRIGSTSWEFMGTKIFSDSRPFM